MTASIEWKDNHMCFACGTENARGLKLTFQPVGKDGLETRVTLGREFQGFQDIVHGGFLGLLLDEVIVNLPWKRWRQVVVTAELTLRLHHPARVNEPLQVTAWPDGESKGRLVPLRGEVRREADGRLIASGRAKCMKVKASL